MNRTLNRKTHALAALSSALLPALLAACGGGAEPEVRAQALVATSVVAPLLDDEGRVQLSDSAAVPADPGARTRSARYATPAQAAQLEAALGARAIPVTVEAGPDGSTAVEVAAGIVFGLQAAHDLPSDAPVLVRGAELRLAATLANRLDDAGLSHVFLVSR